MYHRIGSDGVDPWYLRVDPRHFSQQLQHLTERYRPMTLQAMVAAAREGNIPPGSVALTFDDGYVDNLTDALPLLEEHGVPATVFVATGFVEHQQPWPWEQVQELLLGTAILPSDLDLVLDGVRHRWSIGNGDDLKAPQDDSWKCGDPTSSPRHDLFLALAPLIDALLPEGRLQTIKELERWAGTSSTPPPDRWPLTPAQLERLSNSDLIEIGAHTVWHPMLPALATEAQRIEVSTSKEWLEDLLGEAIVSFAYPHGAYDGEIMNLLKEIGLTSGCITEPGTITGDTNLFALPRLSVDDTQIDVFEERLEQLVGSPPKT
jgi:peptidoglycan/xylan/chitin deacetylase (PgdA/CDA1 family)